VAVAYVNAGTRTSSAGATGATPALPSSRVLGNLLIAVVISKNNAAHTWPSGWTMVDQQDQTTDFTASWGYCWVNGNEAAPAVTWSGSVAAGAIVYQLSGVDFDGPLQVAVQSGTGATHTGTSITAGEAGRIFYLDAAAANTALATPTNFTEHQDSGSGTGATRQALGSRSRAATESSGSISVTGANADWVMWTFELQDRLASRPRISSTDDASTGSLTLTNDGLTFTGAIDTAVQVHRATMGFSGKTYYEINQNTAANTSHVIGLITTETQELSTAIGSDPNLGIQFAGDGYFYSDNVPNYSQFSSTGVDVNVRMRVAVDPAAGLLWVADGTGNWNNNGSADPATGTGGVDISSLGTDLWAAFGNPYPYNSGTVCFSEKMWWHAAPSGFSELEAATVYTLTADAGSFTMTGIAADLIYDDGTEEVTYTYTTGGATGSVTAPAGTTEVRIQTWGAGAGGQASGYGGGGGAYAEVTLTATAGDLVYYSVGAGGTGRADSNTGNPGGDSWGRLNTNSAPTTTAQGALADGGIQAANAGGGTVANSIGTIEYRGGNTAAAPSYDGGGGGAGSGGQGGDCTTTNGVAGAGGTPDGGAGGTGVASGTGGAGTAPGGGGGATLSGTGGAGAAGQVKITFFYVAGGDVTLTADAGSYAMTGQAAGLLLTRRITANAGAFTYTGIAAGLRATRRLTAAVGTYTMTGVAAGLRATRRLTAAVGTYTMTGVAAVLRATRRLTAAVGTYTMTGVAAALELVGGNLFASVGSFTMTGYDATLRVSRTLAAAAGSYAMSGQAAAVKRVLTMAAAAGSFTMTGVAAGVRVARRLAAAAGSYTMTGVAAALALSAQQLIAEAGAFVMTGQAAILRYSRVLPAAAGSYAMTGVAAGVRRARMLAAAVGTFAMTGVAAGFLRARVFAAAAGAFTLTGNDANILRPIRKFLATGYGFVVQFREAEFIRYSYWTGDQEVLDVQEELRTVTPPRERTTMYAQAERRAMRSTGPRTMDAESRRRAT
jgi:hypothetical protein